MKLSVFIETNHIMVNNNVCTYLKGFRTSVDEVVSFRILVSRLQTQVWVQHFSKVGRPSKSRLGRGELRPPDVESDDFTFSGHGDENLRKVQSTWTPRQWTRQVATSSADVLFWYGACMKYVRKIFGILDPPPLIPIFTEPLLRSSSIMLSFTPPPSVDVVYRAP